MNDARNELKGGANASPTIEPDAEMNEASAHARIEDLAPGGPLGELEAAAEEIRSLRAALEAAIKENVESREANRGLDLEVVQLRAMLAEAERQLGNIRQTFIYRIGETIVSARTWKGLRQLPRRLIALRRAYLDKRRLPGPPGPPRTAISERLRYLDEAMRLLDIQGLEAAAGYVRAAPARDREGKARALLELATAVHARDPAQSASLAVEAGVVNPFDPRLRALVLSLFDHGEIGAPALILSTLGETLTGTPIDQARRETILACQRQLTAPLGFPPRAAPAAARPSRVAVVAPRSMPHDLDAGAFRAQAVMEAARDAGLEAWLVTPPGYQYPSPGDGEALNRTLGSTQIIRLPPVGVPPGVFDQFISKTGNLLAQEIARRGVTRVHALGDVSWLAAACWAAREAGAAFTLDVGEAPAFGNDSASGWAKRERFRSELSLFAEVARSADRTILRSRAVASALREYDLFHDAELVDDLAPLDVKRVSETAIQDVRARLGLTNQRIIGVFDSLDLDEGLGDLIDAFPTIRETAPDTVIVFLGTGRGAEPLRQRAAFLGISDHVLMLSYAERRKITDHLSAFAVSVFPKRRAVTPGLAAPFEIQAALAVGSPVVAVDAPWAREWIVDGATGLIVDAGDTDALAAAILRVLGERDLAERLGRAGRDLIRARADGAVIHPLVAATFHSDAARPNS